MLNFSITNDATGIKDAKFNNNRRTEKAISYLKSQGIEPQHIQTQYISVSPHRDYKNGNKITHYTASQSISVCIKDLSKYETISDELLSLGVNNLNGPTFRNSEMRKYKDEARKKAIVAAKEKAQLLAQQLGQSIGKAHNIKEVTGGWAPRSAYANTISDDANGSDVGESFAPGQIEVRATVEVSFLLN